MPVAPSVTQIRDSRAGSVASYSVLAGWVEALQGNGDVPDAVSALMHLIGAQAGVLVRVDRRTQSVRPVVTVARDSGLFPAVPNQSVLPDIMGLNLLKARPGTMWRLSDRNLDLDAATSGARPGPRHCAEALAISLGSETGHVDFVEFQFTGQPLAHNALLLSVMAPTLATSWGARCTGIVARLLSDTFRVVEADDAPAPVPVMDVSNPKGLSRCEFRICALVRDGMMTKDIARTLSVHEVTVRAHLSSIYSKTDTSGMIELLHLLKSDAPGDRGRAPRSVA